MNSQKILRWEENIFNYDHPKTFTVTAKKEVNANETVTNIFYEE